MSTEIEKAAVGGAVEMSQDEAALAQVVRGQVDARRLILPNVKLTQNTTAEVSDDLVAAGRFFNTLTQTDYGPSIEFVTCALFYGYFHRDADGKAFSAREDVVPAHWPEKYAGRRFDELDDTEDNFRDLVNAGEREWGKGPPISTTYNFVGLVVGDATPLPVRVSMMRGLTPVAQKIETLISVSSAPWDRTFVLTAEKRVSARNEPFFGLNLAQGGKTDPELRQQAVSVAKQFIEAQQAGGIELAGEEADEDASPTRKRGGAKKSSGLSMS